MRRRLTIIVAAVALTVAGAALETEKKPVDVVRKLGLVPSFNEDFSGTSLDPRHWRTSYGAKPDAKSTIADRSLPGNNERQIYVEPGYLGLGLNPFRLREGVLTISAEPLSVTARSRVMSELASLPPQKNTAALARVAFSSGLISTRSRFAQRYGYFEMRAKWSGGKGLWPAFWLLPDDGTWPPELDVLEAHGDKPKVAYHTKHSRLEKMEPHRVAVPGGAQIFHSYSMLWTPTTLRFYIDGRETARMTPPADAHRPMFLLANLAIGGSWPGDPDAATPFPATMVIDWIRAWRLPDGWRANGEASLDD